MSKSVIKNTRKIHSHSNENDPTINTRVLALENNEYKILYFQTISSTTGTITKPTGATILLDQFYSGGDAVVETLSNGQPTGQSPLTVGGSVVSVSSFDTSGNYTLSGTPSSFPVALVYIFKIKAIDYVNLTLDNIMSMEQNDFELTSNKQNSLIVDGTGNKYPTVDAVKNEIDFKSRIIVSGGWNFPIFSGLFGTTGNMLGSVYYVPYEIHTTHTVTEIEVECVAFSSGTFFRLAIYNDNNFSPIGGSLIEESGNITLTSTGLKSYTFTSPITLNASSKIVWLAIQSSSSANSFRSIAYIKMHNVPSGIATGLNSIPVKFLTQAFGSMPLVGAVTNISGANPAIMLKSQ